MAESKDSGPKVFDVAKPGNGKADIGSKPMIVGHKSLAEDPMVKEPVKPDDAPAADAPSKTKRIIAPISDDMKSDSENSGEDAKKSVDTEPNTPEAKPSDDAKPKTETNDSTTKKADTPSGDEHEESKQEEPRVDEVSEPENDNKIDPAAQQMERDDKLQKMIDSKKYFVTVHESSGGGHTTFVLTFIAALVIGLAALAVLIDAEILDLGIKLPFDLL